MNSSNSSSFRCYAARINLSSFYGNAIPTVHHESRRTTVCKHCSALLFKNETLRTCCNNGNVKLAEWRKPHQYIEDLFLR
mmetsp:Transcript_13387/g.25131  ORF Transcript_13387/g.25131 Transcript_13387/m.25131 type:complete len:80 (-) Transcript_13387:1029-1268(-)